LQEAAHQQEDTFQVHHSAMFHTSIFMCVMQLQTSSKGSFETMGRKWIALGELTLPNVECISTYTYIGIFVNIYSVYITSIDIFDHTSPSLKLKKKLGPAILKGQISLTHRLE